MMLRASGWRISDVLALRYDTCLEGEGDKWSLVGDIHKTRILGHHVPITADVARRQLAANRERTVASTRLLVAAKDRRIRELEARVKQLEIELAASRGRWYDRL